MSMSVYAQQSSGKCGDSMNWALNESGVLKLSGTGKMYDYAEIKEIPWFASAKPSQITAIEIEDGVESISQLAFYETGIKTLEIPNSVTEIGYAAIANCQSLETVTLSDGMEALSVGLFNNSHSLKYVKMPEKLKEIGAAAFLGCDSLRKASMANTVTEIGEQAFERCLTLESIVVPENVTVIADSAFSEIMSAKEIALPPTLKRIEHGGFYGCANVDEILIPDGVTEIGSNAFTWPDYDRHSDKEQFIYIPESVTKIDRAAVDERTVIYGFAGSEAEKYAKSRKF